MKLVIVEIKDPTPGDVVTVEVTASKRGKNGASHLVRGSWKRPITNEKGEVTGLEDMPAHGPAEVAAGLALCINSECLPECAKACVEGSRLVVQCSDLFMDTVWTSQVQGKGKTTVTVTEF